MAASLPLVLGVLSVIITLRDRDVVASTTEISIYAQSMVSMIGLGVAVDYSLFILARYREELGRGVDERRSGLARDAHVRARRSSSRD